MIITLTTAPDREPVTLAGVKEHLRIVIEDDDFLLEDYIVSARRYVEQITGRAFITQTWTYYMDAWPDGDWFKLPYPPLQSVTSVKYKGTDEAVNTFSSGDYLVDIVSEPGRVMLGYGEVWPSDTLSPKTPVYTEYVCGYGDDRNDVPMDLRLAIMGMVGHWYENREAFKDSAFEMRQVPGFVHALIEQYRVSRFGL